MPKSLPLFVLILLCTAELSAQKKQLSDSSNREVLEDMVVTATRSERVLANVAVPVTVISSKTIQQSGSLRLKDVLQEQTGLFITSGFGSGVQLQGLNPDYTLILVDGEPLVGRTSGVLDLNRVTVGNIKKIEIVKGPSSSLYGSEALAGVINIITDKAFRKKFSLGYRYGSFNTSDANVSVSDKIGKLGINAFFNAYHTDGYSIRPNSIERSTLPVWRLTPQLKFNLPISERTSLTLSARYNYEYIKNEIVVSNNGVAVSSSGRELNKDLNITPTLVHQFSGRVKTTLRMYATQFTGTQKLATASGPGYDDFFQQRLLRLEDQMDINLSKSVSLVTGVGALKEEVSSTRYDSKESIKQNQVAYGFFQTEWMPINRLTFVAGFRYDENKVYASAFSPKVAAQFKLNDQWRFQASYGKGFKAPDFRQLYLNFTNTAAGGYSVYGALEASRVIKAQQAAGLIAELAPEFYKLAALKPELSNGINFGWTGTITKGLEWQTNFFRNDIKELIESRQVASRVDNSQIYSYINVKNAYTQGLESNIKYAINQNWNASAGYQLLYTADKSEKAQVDKGNYYYTRDANNYSVPVKPTDYWGLPNRSRHMLNAKIQYENTDDQWFANLRANYRSKWVVFDKDGNGIYNAQDEFANGFMMFNLSAGKDFKSGYRLQGGIDNLTAYTDLRNLPYMPGRTYYLSLQWNILNNNSNQ
jgi:outer membrane receptor for ferrienterochelin and colicins